MQHEFHDLRYAGVDTLQETCSRWSVEEEADPASGSLCAQSKLLAGLDGVRGQGSGSVKYRKSCRILNRGDADSITCVNVIKIMFHMHTADAYSMTDIFVVGSYKSNN